jgi:hypothetical protein
MKNAPLLTRLRPQLALVAGALLTVAACTQKDLVAPTPGSLATADATANPDKTKTFYGPATPLGQGVGRAWITVNAAGTPIATGVDVSAKSVANQGEEEANYTFQLPKNVAVPPYDHIELGWNPHGHEPDHIYTLPHFDLHFYLVSPAEQASVPFLAPPAFDLAPAPQYLAPAYVQGPGLVPNMGAHWVDVLSAEFQPGSVFTRTFIYGSYHGHVTFLEPMFTLTYLGTLGSETIPIRQPQAFERAGYYPTSYTFSYDSTPGQYHISLNNLQYHKAS